MAIKSRFAELSRHRPQHYSKFLLFILINRNFSLYFRRHIFCRILSLYIYPVQECIIHFLIIQAPKMWHVKVILYVFIIYFKIRIILLLHIVFLYNSLLLRLPLKQLIYYFSRKINTVLRLHRLLPNREHDGLSTYMGGILIKINHITTCYTLITYLVLYLCSFFLYRLTNSKTNKMSQPYTYSKFQ